MASAKIASLLICLVILLSGCATYRGMPSHGGGKRFDEEQRVVAAAIRHAVKQMDLTELEGGQREHLTNPHHRSQIPESSRA